MGQISKPTIAIIAALVLVAAAWAHGNYHYKQGRSAEKADALLDFIAMQEGMQYEYDHIAVRAREAALEREQAQRDVDAAQLRLNRVLQDLRNATATSTRPIVDAEGADWIGVLGACFAEYESMGADAAKLADQVNALIDAEQARTKVYGR